MVVCTEPEELTHANEIHGQSFSMDVTCHPATHSSYQPTCPKLANSAIDLPAPQDWTAEHIATIHRIATETLRCTRLLWSISMTENRARREPIRTKITIRNGWYGPRSEHQIEIGFAGQPNAATMAWLLRQSKRHEFAALLPADPAVDGLTDAVSLRPVKVTFDNDKDQVNGADFDHALARIRRILCAHPSILGPFEDAVTRLENVVKGQTKR
jgi:hypothetical protein